MIRVRRNPDLGTGAKSPDRLVAAAPHLVVVLGSSGPLGAPAGYLLRYPWSMHLPLTGRLSLGMREFCLVADPMHALVLEDGTEATQPFRDAAASRWLSIFMARNGADGPLKQPATQYRVEISRLLAAGARSLWDEDFSDITEHRELHGWVYGMIELAEERRAVLNSTFHRLPGRSLGRRQQLGTALMRTRDYLDSNYHLDISIDKLARIARMSRSSFVRLFRIYFETTPAGYLKTVRMRKAREILAANRCAVHEVAKAVGYRNRSSFVRAFSRHFGYPPRQCPRAVAWAQNGEHTGPGTRLVRERLLTEWRGDEPADREGVKGVKGNEYWAGLQR